GRRGERGAATVAGVLRRGSAPLPARGAARPGRRGRPLPGFRLPFFAWRSARRRPGAWPLPRFPERRPLSPDRQLSEETARALPANDRRLPRAGRRAAEPAGVGPGVPDRLAR